MFRAFLWTGIGAAAGYYTMETMVYNFVPPEQIAFQSRSSWFSVMAVGIILGSAFGAVFGSASAILSELRALRAELRARFDGNKPGPSSPSERT